MGFIHVYSKTLSTPMIRLEIPFNFRNHNSLVKDVNPMLNVPQSLFTYDSGTTEVIRRASTLNLDSDDSLFLHVWFKPVVPWLHTRYSVATSDPFY